MDKRISAVLLALCLAAAPACGRKGPLVLPQGGAPLPVEGLTAVAGEGGIVLRWTNPVKAVSGKPLGPLEAVEVWIFDKGLPAGGGPITSETIEKSARLVRKIPRTAFGAHGGPGGEAARAMTFTYAPAPGTVVPARLAFAVRVVDRKGRASDFADPVAVETALRAPGVDRPAIPGVF